ncbi:MAG: ABC transporter ATP-binding protein, partial [Bryobacterales bacterium]|nr:ABC transporter ATP-binding protein [Bryobacterales bacterium]
VIVILSTHIVDDVKELCTNMAVIHNGQVLFTGTPAAALSSLAGKIWRKSIAKQQIADYEKDHRVISTKLIAGRPLIHVFHPEHPGDGFEPVAPDLEDVFFSSIHGLQ